jgi:acylphosphatase
VFARDDGPVNRIACHVVVAGRVQGVGFRWFVRKAAEGLGVSGWVRNLDDGRVEAWLEGERERVDELLARIRAGRPPAHVAEVAVEAREPEGHARFDVRRDQPPDPTT